MQILLKKKIIFAVCTLSLSGSFDLFFHILLIFKQCSCFFFFFFSWYILHILSICFSGGFPEVLLLAQFWSWWQTHTGSLGGSWFSASRTCQSTRYPIQHTPTSIGETTMQRYFCILRKICTWLTWAKETSYFSL